MSHSSKTVLEGEENRWAELIQQARQRRDVSISSIKPALPDLPADLPLNVTRIPQELLEAHEVKITEKSAEELVKLLAEGKLSAVEVTKSFLRRAALAQRLVRTNFSKTS